MSPSTSRTASVEQRESVKSEEKESVFSRIWKKIDIDLGTFLMMMKAALPPTISLALYQSTSVAETYTTLGYLIAIVSILSFCIMPRAKFFQTMLLNIISTCMASAFAILMMWTGVQARHHTTPPGSPPSRYNSSQSAVCAVWLFFYTYLINSVKAKYPQFVFPTIIYAIFINVSATFGTQWTTTAQMLSFARQLLITFLSGFAIATVVSLFIFPTTSRKIVQKEMIGFIGASRKYLQAHKAYMHSVETSDPFTSNLDDGQMGESKNQAVKPEITALQQITASITELHGKLQADLPFAKREIAFGHLGPDDMSEIAKHLRAIMIPLVGLSALVDLFGRFAEINRADILENPTPETEAFRRKTISDWNAIMKMVHEPFATIIEVMDQGLEHTLLKLRLQKPPKRNNASRDLDVEAKGESVQPGDPDFSNYISDQIEAFYQGKEETLRQWCTRKGIQVSEDLVGAQDNLEEVENELKRETTLEHRVVQRQLYMLLYMEFLLYGISRAILDFARFADKLEAEGRFSKSKIILPGRKRFKKWILRTFHHQNVSDEDSRSISGMDGNGTVIYMGEAFKSKKDPEHLPPRNAWERVGNMIRMIPRFMRSPESTFGFRCACATMSIAVICFLRDTQAFFIKQRLLWALIMVAISMSPTAGQSVFSFILRITGTIIAMLVAWCVWYIPDQHTAGVIVLFFVFVTCGFYIPIKQPRFIIVGMIGVVTTSLVVGYELEVRKIGLDRASSNGQPYYPIYLLGPYRLATVAGGLAVAFIWTFFPYPINEHSALRQTLGAAIYLSANYYSILHETALVRIRGDEGNPQDKSSPGYKLIKARNKTFAKQMLLFQALRQFSNFVRWELPLGGRFPREEYETIMTCVQNIMRYTSVLGYASRTFTHPSLSNHNDQSEAQWFQDFRRIIMSANIPYHETTSVLALLSSSIKNGQPLPPFLKAPQSYPLARELEAVDRDMLSIKHVTEPGYAAFAVIQISMRCINGDIEKLLSTIRKLVGELDFSVHVVNMPEASETASTSTLLNTSSYRSKQD
ncbi:hypothetical protein GQ43DRAFT_377471 [Delitschia confertaspora ATCC 74209]|uniref:ER transporter 6TM N-terminal domain-containing protein n=1 Tax=Delitschia confertaspora ATCC 74209 TaxID=1513339 RepID=A0A9P4MN15_9PLEO|nr:hypothetical protein GQ43DRAFT_377471 [Delitschia confertaspora ATCC 74209]